MRSQAVTAAEAAGRLADQAVRLELVAELIAQAGRSAITQAVAHRAEGLRWYVRPLEAER